MYCSQCGKEIGAADGCACQQNSAVAQATQPAPTMQPAQPEASTLDFGKIAKQMTTKFTANQLIALGACLLILISMFLPFTTVRLGGLEDLFSSYLTTRAVNTSGYAIAFDSFNGFLTMILPLVLMVTFTFILKGATRSLVNLCVCCAAAVYLMGSLFGAYTGIGLYACFLFWACAATAWFLEYKNIQLFKL